MAHQDDNFVLDAVQAFPHGTWEEVRTTADFLARRFGVFAERARIYANFYREAPAHDRVTRTENAARVIGALDELEKFTDYATQARIIALGAEAAEADNCPPPSPNANADTAPIIADAYKNGDLLWRYATEAHLLCESIVPNTADDRIPGVSTGLLNAAYKLYDAPYRWQADWKIAGESVSRPSEKAILEVLRKEIPTLPTMIIGHIKDSLNSSNIG